MGLQIPRLFGLDGEPTTGAYGGFQYATAAGWPGPFAAVTDRVRIRKAARQTQRRR